MNALTPRSFSPLKEGLGGFLSDPLFRDVRSLFRNEPDISVKSEGDLTEIKVGLPGVSPEDVSVSVLDRALKIEVSQSQDETKDNTRSSWFSAWKQVFTLPRDIDEDSISASFENGLLVVLLRRSETPVVEGRRIDIVTSKSTEDALTLTPSDGSST